MRNWMMIVLPFIFGLMVTPVWAAVGQNFEGQMFSLGIKIRDAMRNDPRLKDRAIMIGEFDGKLKAKMSNYGERIKKILKEDLKDLIKDEASFSLDGAYFAVQSTDPTTPNALILRITATITDSNGKLVLERPIEVDINDSDSIYRVLNLTGAAPPQIHNDAQKQFQVNNQAAREALEKPSFEIIGTRVTSTGAPQWAVGILKKSIFNGPTQPVVPQNVKGLAFTSINVNEYYEIELINNDKFDSVATVEVDGLDTANTFATDKDESGREIHWPGYYIPAGQTIVIRGWLNTINENAQGVSNNVFSFRVAELGQGAATAEKTRGSVGAITVQFREACEPGEKLSGRGLGETAQGEGLQEKLDAKPVQIGTKVLSTISIRYNRPE